MIKPFPYYSWACVKFLIVPSGKYSPPPPFLYMAYRPLIDWGIVGGMTEGFKRPITPL